MTGDAVTQLPAVVLAAVAFVVVVAGVTVLACPAWGFIVAGVQLYVLAFFLYDPAPKCEDKRRRP